MATVIDQRLKRAGRPSLRDTKPDKRGAVIKAIKDPLLGFALGRLRYQKVIDAEQFDAGEWFLGIYKVNARLRGWPSPNVRSPGADLVAAGLDCLPEDDPERVIKIRRKWEDAYRAIMDTERDFGRLFEQLKRVLLEDLEPHDIGALRVGLNALARMGRR